MPKWPTYLGNRYPQDFTWFANLILRGRKGRLLNDGTFVNYYGPMLGWQRYPMHQAIFIIGLTQMWEKNPDDRVKNLILRESKNLLQCSTIATSNAIGFPAKFAILGYRLPPVWYSSLTQSFVASAFCRVGLIHSDSEWLEYAGQALRFIIQNKTLCTFEAQSGGFWYQEYPGVPAMPVLNGHLYALVGFLDIASRSDSKEFFSYFDEGLSALLARISCYDANGLAYYDSTRKILAKPYYQKLHVTLLRFLASVTGEKRLYEFADRWEDGFRRKWGMKAWMSYAKKTLENGLRIEGLKFPLSYVSYALGDPGISFVPRITAALP